MAELLEALAAPGAPAAGTALAYIGSMAAALGMMCLVADAAEIAAARTRFVELAARDAEAYRTYQGARGDARAVEEAIAVPLAIAEAARGLWERLAPHREAVPAARGEDLGVALDLLRTVAAGAARLAGFNAESSGRAGTSAHREAQALAAWAAAATVRGRESNG